MTLPLRAEASSSIPELESCAGEEIRRGGMPWSASGGFLSDAASAARLVFGTVYRDGRYVGPKRKRYMSPREVLLNYDFSEIDWSFQIPVLTETWTAERATRSFFQRCREVTEQTPLSELPVKGADAVVFSSAFSREGIPEREVVPIAAMPRVISHCARQYGGDAGSWAPSHMAKMVSAVRDSVSSLFSKSGARSLGLVDPSLSSVKAAVFDLLESSSVPEYIPKCLMGMMIMRVSEESDRERYRDFAMAEKLFGRIYKKVSSRDCFKREDECPLGLKEAVEWASDLEEQQEGRKAEEILGLEITWEESLEVQSAVLHYLMLDLSRKNVTWILRCVNRLRKFAKDKKMLGYVSTTMLQYMSSITQSMISGRVVKAVCSLIRLTKVCWSRMLSMSIAKFLSRGDRSTRKTTAEHHRCVRMLESQIGAIGSIVVCTIKTCAGLGMARLKLDVFTNGGVRVDVRQLSASRNKILFETNQRISQRLADSVLRDRERFQVPVGDIPDETVARELVSKTLVPEDKEYSYVVCMGEEDDPDPEPVDMSGRSPRRSQYVAEMSPKGVVDARAAAERGAFFTVRDVDMEGTIPEYARLGYESCAPSASWAGLDPRTFPTLPPGIWVSDIAKAREAVPAVLGRRPGLFREDMSKGRVIPDVADPPVLRPWLQPILENEIDGAHGLDSLREMLRRAEAAFAPGTRHLKVLSLLRMWLPPSWALRTDSEAEEIRRGLLSGQSMNGESVKAAARSPDKVPDWLVLFVLQDAQIGIHQEGHVTRIRSPLAGISISLPTELLMFKTDSIEDVGAVNYREEDAFSFMSHEVLKSLDLARGLPEDVAHSFDDVAEQAKRAVDVVVRGRTPLTKSTTVSWSMLTFNVQQMVDEEKRSSRRGRVLAFLQKQCSRVNKAYCRALKDREELVRVNAQKRAGVFRRLPIAVQSMQIGRARNALVKKASADEALSAAEGRFVRQLRTSGWRQGDVPSDDIVWAHCLVSAFDI